MKPLGKTMDHYWRVICMAGSLGVDLSELRENGRLSDAEWAEMVQKCRGCEWVGGCSSYLEAGARAHERQAGCVNAAVFDRFLAT